MGAAEFRRHFTAGDGKAFVADLAPGFRFYHASHTQPTSDVAFLEQMFPVARAEADDGRLLEVRITMRPVQAIQAWADAMTTRMGRPSPPHG